MLHEIEPAICCSSSSCYPQHPVSAPSSLHCPALSRERILVIGGWKRQHQPQPLPRNVRFCRECPSVFACEGTAKSGQDVIEGSMVRPVAAMRWLTGQRASSSLSGRESKSTGFNNSLVASLLSHNYTSESEISRVTLANWKQIFTEIPITLERPTSVHRQIPLTV